MVRAVRKKRDSAQHIYNTCRALGTCPQDVIDKVEGTTWADKLLQWFSSVIYLGGLGIGTGSGSGGRAGYVPVGTDAPVRVPTVTPGRTLPPVAVDIAPFEVAPPALEEIPLTVRPSDSSIIPLLEPSETGITVGETSFIDPGPSPGVTISSTSETGPAIIDVSETGPTRVSHSTYHNPSFHNVYPTRPSLGESSNPPPTFLTMAGGLTAPSEDIPLATFSGTSEVNVSAYADTPLDLPSTSTPKPDAAPRTRTGFNLYSRGTEQRNISDPLFLQRPQELVTYTNPAFDDPEETILFEHPSIHEAPDPDFMDIVALHRPALTRTTKGVRYSRIGNRGTIWTRMRTRIGARVHFFQDLSSILPQSSIDVGPELEMEPLTITPESTSDGLFDIMYPDYPDTEDIAPDDPSTPSSQPSRSISIYSAPTQGGLITTGYSTAATTHSAGGSHIIFPADATHPLFPPHILPPVTPLFPSTPTMEYLDPTGIFLFPNYFWTKRRRKQALSAFFADAIVVT